MEKEPFKNGRFNQSWVFHGGKRSNKEAPFFVGFPIEKRLLVKISRFKSSDAPGLASSREATKPKPRLDKPSQAKSTASGGLGLGLGVAEAQAKGAQSRLEGGKMTAQLRC
jgi:hypothetical protein